MDDILIEAYKEQLTPQEKIAFKIAEKQLESSFDIKKTIGFKKWFELNKDKFKKN